jgi:hypothetical protein
MTIVVERDEFERIRMTYGVIHNRPIIDSVPMTVPHPHVETIFPYTSLPALFMISQVYVEQS